MRLSIEANSDAGGAVPTRGGREVEDPGGFGMNHANSNRAARPIGRQFLVAGADRVAKAIALLLRESVRDGRQPAALAHH